MKFLILPILLTIIFVILKIMKLVSGSDSDNIFVKYLNTKNDNKSVQSIIKEKVDKNNFKDTEAIDIDVPTPMSVKSKETGIIRRLLIHRDVNYKETTSIKNSIKRMLLSVNRRSSNNKLLNMKIKLKTLKLADKALFNLLIKKNKNISRNI